MSARNGGAMGIYEYTKSWGLTQYHVHPYPIYTSYTHIKALSIVSQLSPSFPKPQLLFTELG